MYQPQSLNRSQIPLNSSLARSYQPQQGSPIISRSPVKREAEPLVEQEGSGFKRLLNLLILLLPFILAVLFIIFSIKLLHTHLNTTEELEGSDNVLEFVHHNLKANPISQWATTNDEECPGNFEEAELGEWKGIDSGCICKNGNVERTYNALSCEVKENCDFQHGEGDEDYEFWSTPNVRFCERRIGKESWRKVAKCDTSISTQCANSVCLEGLNAQCPPNSAKVSEQADPAADLEKALTDLENTNYSNENSLIIKSAKEDGTQAKTMYSYFDSTADKSKNTAFVDLVISQGKSLCLNDLFTKTNNQIYPLDTQQTKNSACDQYGVLNDDLITVLDNALQSEIFTNNEDIGEEYSSQELVFYDANQYRENQLYLLAVEKIPLNPNNDACDQAYNGDLKDASHLARGTRTAIRVFAWLLLIFAIVTILIGIVFVAAALSSKVANEQPTRKKVAKFYWLSSWIIVALAILLFLLYHFVFSYWQADNEKTLNTVKDGACFPGNEGINLAISKLITFDSEIASKFAPLVNVFFWIAVVYTLIWVAIVAVWKISYSQIKNVIGN